MNEHIKQLAEQCGFRSNPDIYDRNQAFDITKFAELIIDECCVKLLDMDEKTKGNHNYYKHAAIQLKRHFEAQDKPVLQSGGLHYRHPPASEE